MAKKSKKAEPVTQAQIDHLVTKVAGLQMNVDAAFARIAKLEAARIDYAAPVRWWRLWRRQ